MKKLLIFAILFAISPPLLSEPPVEENPLDKIAKTISSDGVSFIKSYTVSQKYQRVDIQIDPSIWDILKPSQQLRVLDSIAQSCFLQKMNLLDAHLFVDSTEIGTITRDMWGGGCTFNKNERYWNP